MILLYVGNRSDVGVGERKGSTECSAFHPPSILFHNNYYVLIKIDCHNHNN